jgi:ubiquinone biosynthesis protein
MVFEDGFFHADPHPGNILIMPRPPEAEDYPPEQPLVIGMLDLGLVGRLTPALRDQTVNLLMAAARHDPDGIADAMLAIGKPQQKVDVDAFRAYIQQMAEAHLNRSLKDIEASAIVRDIVVGAIKFNIEIPADLTMMFRALMTIEGVGKEIYPDFDVLQAAKPLLAKIIWRRYHPLKMGDMFMQNFLRLGNMAKDLPYQLQEIIEDTRRGRLQLNMRDPEATRALERLGKRLRASVMCATLLGAGVSLLALDRQQVLGWLLLSLSLVSFGVHGFFDWLGKPRR